MAIIPPFPYHNNPDIFDPIKEMSSSLKVRPQLFFRLQLKPYGSSDLSSFIPLELMFVSAFAECDLTPDHPLQTAGMEMFYDPSPQPILYVGHVKDALCRLSVMPVFVNGNDTPTIPNDPKLIAKKKKLFPHGKYDTYAGKTKVPGSKLYEINYFLWQYAKGHKRSQNFDEVLDCRKQHEIAFQERRKQRILKQKQSRKRKIEELRRSQAQAGTCHSDSNSSDSESESHSD